MPNVSKGIGRGGKRPGAGRKPKVAKIPAPLGAEAAVPSAADAFDLTKEARAGALKAVERLNKIIEHGTEAAAIKATALLFTWGFVTPANAKASAAAESYRPPAAPAKGYVPPAPPPGKREQRRINAEQSTAEGVFAVPEPPRLVVSNS